MAEPESVLLFEKRLTSSNLVTLNIPIGCVHHFPPIPGIGKDFIDIVVEDAYLNNVYTMRITRYASTRNYCYKMGGHWSAFVAENNARVGGTVEFWREEDGGLTMGYDSYYEDDDMFDDDDEEDDDE